MEMDIKRVVTVPNCITMVRIIGTLCLIFTEPLSTAFFVIYAICGISDILDGTVARLTKAITPLGAKLDSVADLLFYTTMFIKVFPILLGRVSVFVWMIVIAIVAARIINYTVFAVKNKSMASEHTKLNKATGFMVFMMPFAIHTEFFDYYCIVCCIIAGFAVFHELLLHIKKEA